MKFSALTKGLLKEFNRNSLCSALDREIHYGEKSGKPVEPTKPTSYLLFFFFYCGWLKKMGKILETNASNE